MGISVTHSNEGWEKPEANERNEVLAPGAKSDR